MQRRQSDLQKFTTKNNVPEFITLILLWKAEIDLRDQVSLGNLSNLTCALHCTKEDKAEVDNSTINMSFGQQRGRAGIFKESMGARNGVGIGLSYWARTFKCLWGPGIDSKEWIPPAYVAWRDGTKTLFLLGA